MGLYLCIFDNDEEIDGVEIGSYADWNFFVKQVIDKLENNSAGSRFPLLTLHSDCDGKWTTEDCVQLQRDFSTIIFEFKKLPPVPFNSDWQRDVAKRVGVSPTNLYESFIDIDGEFLLDRMVGLASLAPRKGENVIFQ